MYTKVKIRKPRYSFFYEDTELLYIKYKKIFNTQSQHSDEVIENVNPIIIIDLKYESVFSSAAHPNISMTPSFYAYRTVFSVACVGSYNRDIHAAISLKRYDALENIFDEYLSEYNDNGFWFPDGNLVQCPTCKRKIKYSREKVCSGCYYKLYINGRNTYGTNIGNIKNYSISYRNNNSDLNIILTRKKEKKNENVWSN